MGFDFEIGTSIRLQVASLCFLILVIIDFIRSKRIKLLTTRIFSGMLCVSAVYMLFDIATVYSIYMFPGSAVTDIIHRVYYILMLTVVFGMSAYVEFTGNARNKNINNALIAVWILPYIICTLGMLLGDIEYICDESGVYSYGSPVDFLYAGVAVYIVFTFAETFRYKDVLYEKKRFALRMQLIIWIVVALIQLLNPYLLLSGLAISLSISALYFSFENPNVFIDENTGAFNNRAFLQVFYENTNCLGKKNVNLAALIIDDEDIVIDSIGFYRFEELMKMVSEDMRYMFMSPVYRLGSNVFAVIIPESDENFGDKLVKLERKLSYPYRLEDASIELKSHAVTMKCPEITDEPADIHDLIACGTEYGGTGFVRAVNSEIAERKKRSEILSKMMLDAIENDGFEVVYQPIYSTEKKAFVSSEALVRLKDKETLGFVSPEEFIPLAEKNGYIIKIGEIVFEKVCKTIKSMRDMGLKVDYIEVNLSALQSVDEAVPAGFSGIMKKYGISPSSINLEITETTAVESASMLERNMKRFREMGCSFSMDDFGTGYSNLSKMSEVNYDLVKFDKSLIWPSFGENKKTKSEIILTNTVKMVSSLGAHIVAEGVETEEMANSLAEMGVHYLQGYYYSRPISEEAYIEFIKEKQAG
ncbi:MAG: EAL domain-containing protein [Oscillospiraceae bacterium]|nr:EAL domain-containing protein [Oscillospiraceae bacterium]